MYPAGWGGNIFYNKLKYIRFKSKIILCVLYWSQNQSCYFLRTNSLQIIEGAKALSGYDNVHNENNILSELE
jgi:hypothetical protein